MTFYELVLGGRNAQRANDCGRFERILDELQRRARSQHLDTFAAQEAAEDFGKQGCGGRVYTIRYTDPRDVNRFSTFPDSSIFSDEVWHDGGGHAPGVYGGGGAAVTNLPQRSFFGSETAGVINLGGFRIDQNLHLVQFGAGLHFPIAGSDVFNRFDFNFATGDTTSTGSFTPPAGSRTLIPGSTGTASGVALGGAPSIDNINWSWEQTDIAAIWQHGFQRQFAGGFSAGAHVKTGYALTDVKETISGNVPAFLSDFRQWSDARTHQFPLLGGVNVSQVVPLGGNQNLRFFGYAKAGATFLYGNGNHNTQWGGFIGGIVEDSNTRFSESDVRFTYRLGGGVEVISNRYVSLGVSGYYAQRPISVVELNGVDPASLRYEDVQDYGFSARLTARLQ